MSKFPKHFDPGIPRELNELIDLIEKDIRLVKPAIQELIKIGNSKNVASEPSCKTCKNPGCCYQLAYISLYDALPIGRRLRLEGRATKSFIAELRAKGEESEGMGQIGWFDGNRPCVFLTNKKRCSIYENRPLPCSTYYVWSPAENCMPDSPNGHRILMIDAGPVQEMMVKQQVQIIEMLNIWDGRMYIASIPRMVAIILEAMAGDPKDFALHIQRQPYPTSFGFQEWASGKNPFGNQHRNQGQDQRERADHGAVEPLSGPPEGPQHG